MKPIQFRTPAQAVKAPAEQPVSGPVLIDPAMFKLVSGGAPKGGWEIEPIIGQGTPQTPPAALPLNAKALCMRT